MAKLTWLHLSDWHQEGPNFDRQVVRDALIKDIKERTSRINDGLDKIDFIVFSGDLAFHGQATEYATARKELLDRVLEATGLTPSQMFFVPGNHDLDRNLIYDLLPAALQKPLQTDAEVQAWLTDAKKRARLLEPFEAYRKFVTSFNRQKSPDYASIARFEAGGKQVALLGINSAWMCGRKNTAGEFKDYGNALVGEAQIYTALETIKEAEVRVAVLHHSFDWLAEFDRNHVEDRLMQACHFILRGHEHKPKAQFVDGSTGNCVVIPAGACYDRRIAENPIHTNAYNLAQMDFDNGTGEVYLRRWSERRNEWIADTDAHTDGKFTLDRLPKELGSANPKEKASPIRTTPLKPIIQTTRVENETSLPVFSDQPVDFVIVTALAEELDAVLKKLPRYQQLPPAKQHIRIYYQADLPVTFPDNSTGTYRIIASCLSGMGRVQAAAATSDAIRQWHPRYILLTGIAGGIATGEIRIGDILISDQIVDYELQKLNPKSSSVRWNVYRADPRLLIACNNFR